MEGVFAPPSPAANNNVVRPPIAKDQAAGAAPVAAVTPRYDWSDQRYREYIKGIEDKLPDRLPSASTEAILVTRVPAIHVADVIAETLPDFSVPTSYTDDLIIPIRAQRMYDQENLKYFRLSCKVEAFRTQPVIAPERKRPRKRRKLKLKPCL